MEMLREDHGHLSRLREALASGHLHSGRGGTASHVLLRVWDVELSGVSAAAEVWEVW